jgi:hypothetical protein
LVEGSFGRSRNAEKRHHPESYELGRDKGFVTFDELNELWLSTITEPEDVEAVLTALGDEGIHVIEDEKS